MSTYKHLPPFQKKGLFRKNPLGTYFQKFWETRFIWLGGIVGVIVAVAIWSGLRWSQERELEKSSALLNPSDWSESGSLLENYPESDATRLVLMAMGEREFENKNWDQALSHYENLTGLPDRQAMLRVAALQNRGLVHYKKGEWEEALRSLQKAEVDPGNAAPDFTRFLIGVVLEAKGSPDEAVQVYRELASTAVIPAVRQEASRRAERQEGKPEQQEKKPEQQKETKP